MLSKITQEKINDENGWITPIEVKHAFDPLIMDFDTKLTAGELRKDLIMTRLDNFKMELIRRCEQNLERELKRENQSNILGRSARKTSGEQNGGQWQVNDSIPASGKGLGEGSASMDSDFSLAEDGR